MEELVKLKHTGSLNDYQEKFERIACRSNLTEEQKLDCYLGVLKDELAWDVKLFNPRTVLEATRLAKVKEMSLNSTVKWGMQSYDFKKGAATQSRVTGGNQDQRGVLGKPGYRFQTKMTPVEIDEQRAKNLCFFCQ